MLKFPQEICSQIETGNVRWGPSTFKMLVPVTSQGFDVVNIFRKNTIDASV
jgi:hypothetical protein